jgi:hypothetical protein
VVQRRLVHLRGLRRVDRLHQVDLDPERPLARHRDVLVHVLPLAPELADPLEAEQLDPEPPEPRLVCRPDRNLLNPEDPEGTRGRC